MGLLAAVRTWTAHENQAEQSDETARCRNCGRYYAMNDETCPHCGSGNKLRSGPPAGQTRR